MKQKQASYKSTGGNGKAIPYRCSNYMKPEGPVPPKRKISIFDEFFFFFFLLTKLQPDILSNYYYFYFKKKRKEKEKGRGLEHDIYVIGWNMMGLCRWKTYE